MKKPKPDIFDTDLDAEEREISEAIDKAIEQGTLKSIKKH